MGYECLTINNYPCSMLPRLSRCECPTTGHDKACRLPQPAVDAGRGGQVILQAQDVVLQAQAPPRSWLAGHLATTRATLERGPRGEGHPGRLPRCNNNRFEHGYPEPFSVPPTAAGCR